MSRRSSRTPNKTNPSIEKTFQHNDGVSISKMDAKETEIHYEFGGVFGTFMITFTLPLIVIFLFYICNDEICLNTSDLASYDALVNFSKEWIKTVPMTFDKYVSLCSNYGFTIICGWYALNILFGYYLPGEKVQGTTLPKSSHASNAAAPEKLTYVMSGHLQFWLCLIVLFCGNISVVSDSTKEGSPYYLSFAPVIDMSLIYAHYIELICVSIVLSYLLSIYLYFTSFMPNKLLAKGGNTGYWCYDFYMGRELNPRIWSGTFDLKEFCELRPGLIGWCVLNICMAYSQYKQSNYMGISGSMFCIVLYQGIYVWDALYNEKAILTTMDITTDGFGFMLAFGDLTWVPFVYSLQARYLVDHDPNLSLTSLLFITALHFLGYYIFRSANSEKDMFRNDPDHPSVSHLKFLVTKKTGRKLLTSGWWGLARKINYTGDFLITLSWCLLCGFDSPIPYFQAIYFLFLLIHRAERDNISCSEKYGEDWDEYKKRVPYMFIPFVV